METRYRLIAKLDSLTNGSTYLTEARRNNKRSGEVTIT
jgi:hypothetical protein